MVQFLKNLLDIWQETFQIMFVFSIFQLNVHLGWISSIPSKIALKFLKENLKITLAHTPMYTKLLYLNRTIPLTWLFPTVLFLRLLKPFPSVGTRARPRPPVRTVREISTANERSSVWLPAAGSFLPASYPHWSLALPILLECSPDCSACLLSVLTPGRY